MDLVFPKVNKESLEVILDQNNIMNPKYLIPKIKVLHFNKSTI